MKEAGIVVNDRPKIHSDSPTVDDHSIYFPETRLRIPLQLHGTFSYFPTTAPTPTFLNTNEDVYLLTHILWKPHDDTYAYNEDSILDWEVYIIPPTERTHFVMSEVDENTTMSDAILISPQEIASIDHAMDSREDHDDEFDHAFETVPRDANRITRTLNTVSPILDDKLMLDRLSEIDWLSSYKMSVGSIDMTDDPYMYDDSSATAAPADAHSLSEKMTYLMSMYSLACLMQAETGLSIWMRSW